MSSSSNENQHRHKHSTEPQSTVDSKDIDNFTKMGHEWWDPNGKLKPLFDMNPLRLKLIRDGLAITGHEESSESRYLEGVRILDVGCGGGILSEALAKAGARVTGLDASNELINIARSHAALDTSFKPDDLSYVVSSIEDFSQENKEKYDVVVASEILEHVFNPDMFLKNCLEVLKPNGSIFITTISRTRFSWLYAIIFLEYVCNAISKGTHEWDKFITPEETSAILEKYNCKVQLVRGSIYNPVMKYWAEISSTSAFYALHAIKQSSKHN